MRLLLSLVALLIGAVFEWGARPFTHPKDVPSFLRKHPPLLLALGFGLWVVIASVFSKVPAISLTGSLNIGDEGALWYLLLSLIFVVVYLYCLREPKALPRLGAALLISGALVTVIGFMEVLQGQSVIWTNGQVPIVTFLGTGHLASLFVLVLGVALGFWYQKNAFGLGVTFLLTLGIGLTVNRTAIIAAVLVLLFGIRLPRRMLIATLVTAVGIFVGTFTAKIVEAPTQGNRNISDSTSLQTRRYLWEAALKAILARPITGWGGGDAFALDWYRFLSFEDLEHYLQLEFRAPMLRDVIGEEGIPIYALESANGDIGFITVTNVHVHNQFLDIAKMWGLVGLALYLGLFALALRNAFSLQPAALGIVAVHVFFMLWYSTVPLEGILWVTWAMACLTIKSSDGRSQSETLSAHM